MLIYFQNMVVGDDVMDKRLIFLMLGVTIFFFGMWYDMPGVGNYIGSTFVNTYVRGVGGFLIALGLSLSCNGLLLFFFDEKLGE